MYALGSTGRLYTVDTATAALTLKSTLVAALGDVTAPYAGLLGTEFGVDFNPGNDLVRVVSDTGQNFRVTPDDGVVTTDVDSESGGPGARRGRVRQQLRRRERFVLLHDRLRERRAAGRRPPVRQRHPGRHASRRRARAWT